MLPLIERCKDCVFCVLDQIITCFGNHTYYKCKHPDIVISQFTDTDPLEELEGNFPLWCPLEDAKE